MSGDDRAANLALESDMAILRAEAGILMDVVSELDDAMLERIPSGKLLRAWRACSESEKHKMFESKVDALTRQRDRLAELLRRAVEHWGDYAPAPNSKARKTLDECRAELASITAAREGQS